jgi:hypothetical protein
MPEDAFFGRVSITFELERMPVLCPAHHTVDAFDLG